jgi:hypothetical protein
VEWNLEGGSQNLEPNLERWKPEPGTERGAGTRLLEPNLERGSRNLEPNVEPEPGTWNRTWSLEPGTWN